MGASLSVSLTQTGKNETSRTATVSIKVTITSTAGTHNHYGSSNLGQGAYLSVSVDGGSGYSSYITFGSEEIGTFKSTVYSNSFTVSYDSSGTKTVTASAVCVTGTSAGTIRGSDSVTLTPISPSGGGSGGGDEGGEEWDPDNPGSGGGNYGDDYDPNLRLPGNCTVVGQAFLTQPSDNITYYPNVDYEIGTYSYNNFVIVKFVTPAFTGTSSSLDIDFYDTRSSNYLYTPKLCCAICTSDENNEMYFNGTSVVDDPTQIANVLLLDGEYASFGDGFSIDTNQLKGNTPYYLVLWLLTPDPDNVPIEIGQARYHGINVNYDDSGDDLIHIDNGTESIVHLCFIDNGTTWEEYDVYIDNGTSWEPY